MSTDANTDAGTDEPAATDRRDDRDVASWVGAAVSGALGIAAAAVAALVVLLLTYLFGLAVGFPLGDASTAREVTGAASPIAGIVWLATLGIFGQISFGVVSGGASVLTASIFFVPALVFVAAGTGTAWWSFRQERARAAKTSPRGIWARGAVSGATAGVLIVALSLAAHARVGLGAYFGGAEATATTLTPLSFFGPFVIIALAAVGGRWLAQKVSGKNFGIRLWNAPSRLRWGLRDVYDYVALLTLVFVPLSLLAAIVSGEVLPVWPAGAGLFTVAAVVLGHFGGYSVAVSVPGAPPQAPVFTLFSAQTPPLAWVLVAAAVLTALVAALLIARRRVHTPVPLQRAWVLPVSMLVIAVVVGLAFGTASLFGDAEMVTSVTLSATLMPTAWSFGLALLWGAVVEALARTVAPRMAATWPLLGRLRLAGDGVPPEAPGESATDASPGAPGLAPPVALSAAAKKRWVVGGILTAVVAAVAIAGGITVSVLQNSVFSPKNVAQSYVDDIAAGRFAAASAAGGSASASAEGTRGDPALVKATQVTLRAGITDVTLGDPISGAQHSRIIPVHYVLAGTPQTGSVTLLPSGKTALFFDTYTIARGLELPTTVYAPGLTSVNIGGVTVALTETGAATVLAYPGIFDVTAPDSRWLSVTADPLTVGQTASTVSVQTAPSPAFVDEVQKQVTAAINTCAASTEAEPKGCPFQVSTFGKIRNVTWKVTTPPTADVNSLESVTVSGGSVTANYESQDFFDEKKWTPEHSTSEVYAYGEIAIDGDTVTVTLK